MYGIVDIVAMTTFTLWRPLAAHAH